MEREFRGIWLPKEVWLDKRLNALEKVILAEIDSLDQDESGCYASNAYLADFCHCSETKVSLAISKLTEYGYIYTRSFDGRTRFLKSSLSKNERQSFKNCKAAFQNMNGNNIDNNIDNIIEDNKPFDSDVMNKVFNEWLQYKKERKQTYQATGKKQLINRLKKDIQEYGEAAVVKGIQQSMANGWAGIYIHHDEKTNQKKEQGKASYDINRAAEKANTTVPKFKKKERGL